MQIKSFSDRVSAYMSRTAQAVGCQKILVGVSGGVDSVVLLHVLLDLGYECEVLHVNYQLRGIESDEDERFVSHLCEQREVKFHAHKASVEPSMVSSGRSMQMIARDIRYTVFARIASERQFLVVAVGHHGDDQSESLLINLNRGAGPEGIAGMRPLRCLDGQISLIRPLLTETRTSILEFAEANHLKWREDKSNQDEAYFRSKIRSRVMPYLNSDALTRSSNLVRQWVDQVINPMIDEHFKLASDRQSLEIEYLRKVPSVLAHRLVIEGVRQWIPNANVSEDLIKRVIGLINQQTGKRIEVGGGAIWRDRNYLVFNDLMDDHHVEISKLDLDSTIVTLSSGALRLNVTNSVPIQLSIPDGVWLDAEKLCFPLTVRTWLPGDQIQPLGMIGTKKVSDVLTDLAVPVSQRASTLVVCSGGVIAWIVGHRMAHQFRITDATKKYAKLCLQRN